MSARAEGERIARLLGLERLPEEDGLFRRTYVDVSAFRLGRRAELLAGWPHAAPRIRVLTRT